MGRIACSILFIMLCSGAPAQDTTLQLKLRHEAYGAFTDFTVDLQGNVYLVTSTGGIRKFDEHGDSVAVFNDIRQYGQVHSIDAGNPFRVLVFYRNNATVVLLDRMLNARQVIDLRKLNMAQVTAARLAYDNNIWLYDAQAARIRKIDDNGKLLSESADLRNVFPEAPSFETIIDADRSLYLYDTARGWYAFDYYGGFTGRFDFRGWKDAGVAGGRLSGRMDGCLVSAAPSPLSVAMRQCPPAIGKALKVLAMPRRLYVLQPGHLQIYDAP